METWERAGSVQWSLGDPFRTITVIDGEGTLELDGARHRFRTGDHVLLPAGSDPVQIHGRARRISCRTRKAGERKQ
ncbi:cupin domain-containing protein [Staphylospora marina]|uniref:cupin domain-containing protein n=1 Tax=Staphylospora marina TaxID=2490858 RepID=UPI0013DE3512